MNCTMLFDALCVAMLPMISPCFHHFSSISVVRRFRRYKHSLKWQVWRHTLYLSECNAVWSGTVIWHYQWAKWHPAQGEKSFCGFHPRWALAIVAALELSPVFGVLDARYAKLEADLWMKCILLPGASMSPFFVGFQNAWTCLISV